MSSSNCCIAAENAILRDEEEASRVFDTRLVLRLLSSTRSSVRSTAIPLNSKIMRRLAWLA